MSSATTRAPAKSPRPEFRNIHVFDILRYRYPPSAVVSILHRISGGLLFLLLPALLWLFDRSLMSESSYEGLRAATSNVFVKLVLLAVIWAFVHHLVAGIRYLLLDLHVGVELQPASRSARVVHVFSIPVTIVAALWLFGVF